VNNGEALVDGGNVGDVELNKKSTNRIIRPAKKNMVN
jgi:hypothetical protein